MQKTYPTLHWTLTLLLAPFTSQVLQYAFVPNPHQIVGLLEVYPIAVVFSVAFSLPTLLVYITCFYFLSKHDIGLKTSKIVLVTVSVVGVYITMEVVKGTMSKDISLAYSLTALLVGLILPLKRTTTSVHDNLLST